MGINLGKFVHTKTGQIIMSILLGFGLACLFRSVCKNKDCILFYAPPLEDFKDKIYKNANGKCVQYDYIPTKCNPTAKIVSFK
jgi:hypothetical protein